MTFSRTQRVAYGFVSLVVGDAALLLYMLLNAVRVRTALLAAHVGQPYGQIPVAIQVFAMYAAFSLIGWLSVGVPVVLLLPVSSIIRWLASGGHFGSVPRSSRNGRHHPGALAGSHTLTKEQLGTRYGSPLSASVLVPTTRKTSARPRRVGRPRRAQGQRALEEAKQRFRKSAAFCDSTLGFFVPA